MQISEDNIPYTMQKLDQAHAYKYRKATPIIQKKIAEINELMVNQKVISPAYPNCIGTIKSVRYTDTHKINAVVLFNGTKAGYNLPDMLYNSSLSFLTDLKNDAIKNKIKEICEDIDRIASNKTESEEKLEADLAYYENKIKEIEEDIQKEVSLKKSEPTPVFHSNNTLYIYGGTINCERCSHDIRQVRADINTIDGERALINASYCMNCRIFFLRKSEYDFYRRKYRFLPLLFELADCPTTGEKLDLRANSPLSLCGYTVARDPGYSKEERWLILGTVIRLGIVKKWEVIDYLSFFIKLNGKKECNAEAVAKWTEDLDFVRKYDFEKQPIVTINDVKRWNNQAVEGIGLKSINQKKSQK